MRLPLPLLLLLLWQASPSLAYGSMGSLAAVYDSSGSAAAVCGLVQHNHTLLCLSWSSPAAPPLLSTLRPSGKPFAGISGGQNILCGLRGDTWRPLCWEFVPDSGVAAQPKRMADAEYAHLAVGSTQLCALQSGSNGSDGGSATCWRAGDGVVPPPSGRVMVGIATGDRFACGLDAASGRPICWGDGLDSVVVPNASFSSIYAGARHACALTPAFNAQCWGDDSYSQLQPTRKNDDGGGQSVQFLSLALGLRHSCAIDAFSRLTSCWGDDNRNQTAVPALLSFLYIAAGDFFTCGVLASNFSVFCWGGPIFGAAGAVLPQLGPLLPSPCTSATCSDGSFQQPDPSICASVDLHVCTPCRIGCASALSTQTAQCTVEHDISCSNSSITVSPVATPSPSPSPSSATALSAPAPILIVYLQGEDEKESRRVIILVVFGSIGIVLGVATVAWCVWVKFHGPGGFSMDGSQGRVHSAASAAAALIAAPALGSIRRQRSSTSSARVGGRGSETGKARAFLVSEMMVATAGFAQENKIATGSFGAVYRGVLSDGTEVAIKRREKSLKWVGVEAEKPTEGGGGTMKLADDGKESAFESELEFLSRLHHKHLVSLVGYCDEGEERILVYEYMPNGTLHDHLHSDGGGAQALGWRRRMKLALEAARGVEYLHSYAVPPIIHRDIKSSNILLDGEWRARVSDFGLSTRGPSGVDSHLSLMAAGTLGYMDPEYYRLQHLTLKSDVYSFGVLLLELLTGCRAIHRRSNGPVNIVDYAAPLIAADGVAAVLDRRPAPPSPAEMAALEVIARVAVACVRLEGKSRPTMVDIVGVLERAVIAGSGDQGQGHGSEGAAASAEFPENHGMYDGDSGRRSSVGAAAVEWINDDTYDHDGGGGDFSFDLEKAVEDDREQQRHLHQGMD